MNQPYPVFGTAAAVSGARGLAYAEGHREVVRGGERLAFDRLRVVEFYKRCGEACNPVEWRT